MNLDIRKKFIILAMLVPLTACIYDGRGGYNRDHDDHDRHGHDDDRGGDRDHHDDDRDHHGDDHR